MVTLCLGLATIVAVQRARRRSTGRLERLPVHAPISPVGLSRWAVTDFYPETRQLWGAMQIRPHPALAHTHLVATFRGAVLQLRRT
jgi:hypothetical protein